TERLATRLGLGDRLHLLGIRRDVPEILRTFDVFMLTSRWEGLPRVVLEAMASGLPVVASSVDGTAEVVRDGVNGLLVGAGGVGGVRRAVAGVEVVFPVAAQRAVLRSVEHPLTTDLAHTHGPLLVLKAALDAGVRRVVSSSSSSVYGGADQLPTPEAAPLVPR